MSFLIIPYAVHFLPLGSPIAFRIIFRRLLSRNDENERESDPSRGKMSFADLRRNVLLIRVFLSDLAGLYSDLKS